jgi:hypothetical protein
MTGREILHISQRNEIFFDKTMNPTSMKIHLATTHGEDTNIATEGLI